MMNRNTITFMLGTLGLFLVYWWVMATYYPAPKISQGSVVPTTITAEAKATAVSVVKDSQIPTVIQGKGKPWVVNTKSLQISGRVEDGAILQVTWVKDGTRFFPETVQGTSKQPNLPGFPGLGGTEASVFEADPIIQKENDKQTITFKNELGDELAYTVPEDGSVIRVSFLTKRGTKISLIRKPNEIASVRGLGRLFTLQDKALTEVAWSDMLEDPWFMWLGRKRKQLPQESSRLGIDAGMGNQGEPAQTQYFTAIWETPRLPQRQPDANPGYTVDAGQDGKLEARLYLGPKQVESLSSFGNEYKQVMSFGFFGSIAKGMFWILRGIQKFIPNWGWTLVVFAIVIRVALWSLNTKSTLQMLRMKDMEPHQKAIQAKYEKFGNDMTKKAEMQKELMAFYKKNGHNPMGGCWPMLVQMPVFMALWSMIQNVYELRGAPWMWWIKDLSATDKFFVLPILLGVSMFVQSKMTPTAGGDPMQKKMMLYMMPAMMVFFFGSSPSGLCLYYLVYNLVHLFHTWLLLRSYKPQPVIV